MRSSHLSLLALLCLACTATEAPRKTAREHPAAVTPDPTSPMERAITHFDRAWDAHERGDKAEAERLAREALAALDPETDENTDWARVTLLKHLSSFFDFRLGDRGMGRFVGRRESSAFRRFDGLGQWAHAPVVGSSPGPLERPTNLDIFRTAQPPATEAESERVAQQPGEDGDAAVQPAPAAAHSEAELGAAGAHTADPAESSLERIASEKLLVKARYLLRFDYPVEARSLLERGLRELERRGLADSSEATKIGELLAQVPEGPRGGGRTRVELAGSTSESDPLALPGAPESPARGTVEAAFDPSPEALLKFVDALPKNPRSGPPAAASKLNGEGELFLAAKQYDSARDSFEAALTTTLDPKGPDALRARMGLARVAAAVDPAGDSLELFQHVEQESRDQYRPGNPLILEAQERRGAAVRAAQGDEAFRDLLELRLTDQEKALGADHAATRSTRRVLAAACSDLGDSARALELWVAELESLNRTIPAGHPLVSQTRLALAEQLEGLGEWSAALAALGESSEARGSGGDAARDPLRRMEDSALEHQSRCELAKALEVRRQHVDLARRTLTPQDPERAEGLRDLAALLRVLGRGDEARAVELEAQLLGRTPAGGDERLARRKAELQASGAARIPAPRVTLTHAGPDGGPWRVTAEIEDPAGIGAVHLFLDGIPSRPSLDDGAWRLDPTGTRGWLEIPISLPEGEDLTLVVVGAENLQHVHGVSNAVLLSR